jgi:drug/metabolite transporter (DMT)-like permease
MTVPRRVVVFLCIGLAAASQSGNIIRIGEAHPVAMAAWRLLIASCLLAPLAGRDLLKLRELSRREVLLLFAAGLALAAHFFTWIAAVQLTTVANAAVFFSINPVITAAGGWLVFGERVGGRLLVSIVLGIAGVAVIGGGDLSFSREHLPGDGMAILCSVLFTVYMLLGKRLRRVLPTTAYVTAIYGVAALAGFTCMPIFGLPLAGYSPATWLCFFLLALFPTMIGHTSFNNASRYIHAGKIATATLSEPLLAGLVAWYAWNEAVSLQTAAGYAVICLSVMVLVSDRAAPGGR